MSVPALHLRPAWALLKKHHQKIRRTAPPAALRQGSRARREARGRGRRNLFRLFQEPDHRRNPGLAAAACPGVGLARAHRRHVPRREDQHLGEARGAARRPARAARRLHHRSTARMSCPRSMPFSTRWPRSPIGCAAATGRAIPASASATWSTSASAARTSGPVMAYEALQALQRAGDDLPLRLQRRRHGLRRGGAATSIRRRRCSSSPPRPSPRWRP